MDKLPVIILSLVLFMEAIILYFLVNIRIGKFLIKWDNTLKEKYLFNIFNAILDFISSDEIVEETLIGTTISNSGIFNLSSFRKFLETKINSEKDKILKIGKQIEEMEKIEKELSKISSYIQNSKYANLAVAPFLLLPIFLPSTISDVLLGISLGLEILSLYFSSYSYFSYKSILNTVSSCCREYT